MIYWGDIDAHGFEILDGFRAAGVPVASILMDLATYTEYARFGTKHDANGNVLTAGSRKALPHLTFDERAAYELLTDPGWGGVRRIEQERIPLSVARDVVRRSGV